MQMEKILKPCDKEHMKMAMLKHEETFKQQVYELHRLYRVQKILMKGVENNKPKRLNKQKLDFCSKISLNRTNSNSHKVFQKPQQGFNINEGLEIEDESRIELTLGPTNYNRRKRTEASDSGVSFSSSSSGSSHVINGAPNQGPCQNQENLAWGLTMVNDDSNSGYRNAKSNLGRLNQDPWLLQALSLNMS